LPGGRLAAPRRSSDRDDGSGHTNPPAGGGPGAKGAMWCSFAYLRSQ
jgi:hypothetical protein